MRPYIQQGIQSLGTAIGGFAFLTAGRCELTA